MLHAPHSFNDRELRWVAEEKWTFQRQFDVSDGLLAADCVDLLLSGIDTVADIQLNGVHLLSTANAFRYDLHTRVDLHLSTREGGARLTEAGCC